MRRAVITTGFIFLLSACNSSHIERNVETSGSFSSTESISSAPLPLGNIQGVRVEAVPDEIFERANTFLIARVGEDYFRRNYHLQKDKSGIWTGADTWYAIIYTFAPLTKIADQEMPMKIMVHKDPNSTPAGFISCAAGKISEPKITRSEAFDIIEDTAEHKRAIDTVQLAAIDPFNASSQECWKWVSAVQVIKGPPCWTAEVVKVDVATGIAKKDLLTSCE